MEELRLPWNPKEGLLFGGIIAFISCCLIGGANIYLSVGDNWGHAMITSFPLVFVFAMLISNTYVSWISGRVVKHFVHPQDHPDTYICYNLIVCVLLMSISMSLLGPFSGQVAGVIFDGEHLDIAEIFEHWRFIWPRNFCIAFWVEMCVAQPVARKVMTQIHKKKLAGQAQEAA